MSKESVQEPASMSADTRNAGDVKAMIDHGGEVNADVSGKIRNAGHVDEARSADEPYHESDANYVESDDETLIVKSSGSQTGEHSYTPSEIEELHQNNENQDCLISEADADKMQDVHKVKFGHTEVNAVDRDCNTALLYAARNGHSEVVEALFRNNAGATIHNASSKTPLHIAAEMGHEEIVKAMIDHHDEVNAVDQNGDTALHLAARNGHSAVVNVLLNLTLERYARTRSQLAVNQVPLTELELSQHRILNTVDVDQTSHLIAAEGGNVEIANILPSLSSTVNAVCERQATPHHPAVEHGRAEIVENLMSNSANVNACNNAKMTPLHLACQNGHTSIVEILLDNHAIVDVVKQSEETPFYLAAKNGHAAVSDLLLRRGVCDFVESLFKYQTPLEVAIEEGHTEVVEVILKHSCRLYEKLTKDEKKLEENAKMQVELLKEDGRLFSAELVWTEIITPLELPTDLYGDTELARQAFSNDQKMDNLFLSVYQCIYSESNIAKRFRDIVTKIQSVYVSHGFPCDLIKYRMNFRKDVQFLINSSKFIVNHQDWYLNTFLHVVLWQGNAESEWLDLPNEFINDVIQFLLENGTDFNMKNSVGETPLMAAVEKGNCGAIQMLFEWEAKSGTKLDLDARDRNGETALIKASERNHVSVVRLLLNHNASVNLQDYYGFTALHAAIHQPNKNWVDLHFICKGLRKRKFESINTFEIRSKDDPTWRKNVVDPYTVLRRLQSYLENKKETTRLKEEVVNLLLDNDEINVNAIDLRGNTPLDLAVKSSKRISSAIFEALKNRGAICNLQEPEDEVERVDKRGRNRLHRLVLSRISDNVNEYDTVTKRDQDSEKFNLMVYGILLRSENFRESATATDYKGRTPLHYAVMTPFYLDDRNYELVRVLLKLGSNLSAADMYGKTPLHYTEMDDQYEFLIKYGADENIKDKHGHTPKDLKQLRELVTTNEDNTKKLPIGKKAIYLPRDITQILGTNHVTELSKRKLDETIRIYSQSPRPQESSEEAIWKIWTQNELTRLNRRLSRLNPLIQHFMDRLANSIKEKDWRFECQPILVGSADEETKAVLVSDFDFNFKLTKFSQCCDPFPHPLGPKGYFQLRRKPNDDTKSRRDEKVDSFFNSDQCLLTNEVNSRFQIILEEVLGDYNFWEDEHLLELNATHADKRRSKAENLARLCRTLKLRMIHPIEDEEDGFIFVDISIDIVACIHVEGWWPEVPLPVGISPSVKTDGSTMVFDRPRFDPSKSQDIGFLFSETFVRISFAPLESRIIKEGSPLLKSAYIVCKMILSDRSRTTYQLKTCLLFCMEALNARNESETRNEDEITPKRLLFWVERIMFCFTEFSRYDVFPCYFMPSFKQRVAKLSTNDYRLGEYPEDTISYSPVYDIYLDLCPNDTSIDIPVHHNESTDESLYSNCVPKWEQFDREEFIRKISSRSSSKVM